MSSVTVGKCEVCNKESHKYKCPQCLIRYCSLGCFKTHKESKCEPRNEQNNKQETFPSNTANTANEEDVSNDKVPEALLKRLGECDSLKEQVSNHHLQHILTALDKSSDPGKQIEKLMKEPLFVEFVDQCLQLVEPQNEEQPRDAV